VRFSFAKKEVNECIGDVSSIVRGNYIGPNPNALSDSKRDALRRGDETPIVVQCRIVRVNVGVNSAEPELSYR
jgi:hypothetical protein